jgi:hypothetical protein
VVTYHVDEDVDDWLKIRPNACVRGDMAKLPLFLLWSLLLLGVATRFGDLVPFRVVVVDVLSSFLMTPTRSVIAADHHRPDPNNTSINQSMRYVCVSMCH